MLIVSGLATGQVLQRNKDGRASALIEGTFADGGTLTICLKNSNPKHVPTNLRINGDAKDGKFRVLLEGIPTGGPYTICISSKTETICLGSIYVGDVWMLAGQSNMEGVGRPLKPMRSHSLVRARFMNGKWGIAREPLHVLADSTDRVHYSWPDTPKARRHARQTSEGRCGPGVFFGNEMLKRSGGVPQGLLLAAQGGTSMKQWSPSLLEKGGGSLYGSMLKTLRSTGQHIAGILWYQGENEANAEDAPLYTKRMLNFVSAFRRDAKQEDLPFIMVQIGKYNAAIPDSSHWKSIQRQQIELADKVRNLECVASVDLEMDDLIHIGAEGLKRLAIRLARMADRLAYGNKSEAPPPRLVSAKRIAPSKRFLNGAYAVEMVFENAVAGLRSSGEPCGFSFTDENGIAVPIIYKTKITGNTVRIETMNQENIKSYNLVYGVGIAPYCSITDGRDMAIPVLPPIAVKDTLPKYSLILDWMISEMLPAQKNFSEIDPPSENIQNTSKKRTFMGPFFDLHDEWQGKASMVYATVSIKVDTGREVCLLYGYDGPFKMWIDGLPVHCDPYGSNPIIVDEHSFTTMMSKGIHRISIAFDNNDARGWGFCMKIHGADIDF